MKKLILMLLLVCLTVLPVMAGGKKEVKEGGVVNLYTHRHYDVDQQLYDKFFEKTGIKVNVVKAKSDELIERLKSEGSASPADVLMTVDAGRLGRAVDLGLLKPISSEKLEKAIPAHLRDPEGRWFAFTKRARVIAYDKDRVNPADLSTYEALADPVWKGKIVIRSSSNIYNQSLMASIIAAHGPAEAEKWAKGMVANMARSPQGNDRDQVKAVAAGQADIAIINTYYLGKLLNSDDPEQVNAGKKVKLFFPNQNGRGTHINVSGAGVTANAPNEANAVKFLEFLASPEAQSVFAQKNYEYPVVKGIAPSELVASWGTFKEDTLNMAELGKLNTEAVIIFDKAGWK